MGIIIYVSLTSGNKEIKMKQEFVKHVLDCKKIDYEELDISDAANEEKKQFMRGSAKAKEGQNVPLPPQVYNGDKYLGDYDAFLEANECDELYEFLNLAPAKSTSEAAVTLSECPPDLPESAPPGYVEPQVEDDEHPVLKTKITITLANTENGQ